MDAEGSPGLTILLEGKLCFVCRVSKLLRNSTTRVTTLWKGDFAYKHVLLNTEDAPIVQYLLGPEEILKHSCLRGSTN